MGTYSHFTQFAAQTLNQSVAFAHGLGAKPDMVIIQYHGTMQVTTGSFFHQATDDAVGVTLNPGSGSAVFQTPPFKVWTILAHSIIR